MIKRFLPVLLCFLTMCTCGGVFATWKYASYGAMPVSTEFAASLSVFDYTPDEILPGGSNEEAELGGDHMALIQLILYEDEKDYGLNINRNALIHQHLKKDSIVYSNQKISGGNLKFILDPRHNTHGLYYCISKISDTEYYCYTFSTSDLSSAGGSSMEIPVYRTSLYKTDIWRATTSYLGYAKTKSMRALGESASSGSIDYSIDVSTWRHQ